MLGGVLRTDPLWKGEEAVQGLVFHGGADGAVHGLVEHQSSGVGHRLRLRVIDAALLHGELVENPVRVLRAAPLHLQRLGRIRSQAIQGDGHPGLSRRVGRGDGGPLTEEVGGEPILPVWSLPQCDALPAVGDEGVLIVEAEQISIPLSGYDVYISPVIGVSVEVVIGVIVREVGKVLQPRPVGCGQGEIGVFFQYGIQIRGGALGQINPRVLAAVSGPAHRLPFRLVRVRREAGAVIEELEEIDVLRPFVGGGEELVADVEVPIIEELLVEVPQFFSGEGPVGLGGGAVRVL